MVLVWEHQPVYTLGRGADESHLTFLQHDADRLALSRKNRQGARLSVDPRSHLDPLGHGSSLDAAVRQLVAVTSPTTTVYAPNGAPVYRVERGGEVTWHGPGQVVVYPLLDLQRPPMQADLHWYLRQVEQVIIDVLQEEYDITGARDDINTGVWVDECKIAAVGVNASRWITTHGLALNVQPDMARYFDTNVLLPCGVPGRGVTSVAQILEARGQADRIPTVTQVADALLHKMELVFGIHRLGETLIESDDGCGSEDELEEEMGTNQAIE